MQLLGGKLKGRKIKVPPGVRPVSQRVKKSCFDIIFELTNGKTVLDLYAGSGSLGIEAISRGASRVVFVDQDKNSIKFIDNNINSLGIGKDTEIYCKKCSLAIKYLYRKKICFDLIFLDPPYYKGLITKSLQLLESYDILARSGYLIGFCYENDDYAQKYKNFSLVIKRNYGQSSLLIYKK
ncbi:MAG: 16S rRNA (guanine(966)-N(2))-methyltransferase RsmD [Candidatus Omnitrophica bacterium]|nr:16S rRNA (guanine(966)-N(2))-methyltransferase RsmD [Candidatus Omnitrophota bacterium]MCF7894139.1 16S rRNA (guanine(966)-N(2))-methyltransferase RsmD [Candidatus Omnitrophota bacterium]